MQIKINGSVTIVGRLEVGKFNVSSAYLNSINNNLWKPMLWLSKSKIQTVDVPLYAPVIRIISLLVTNPNNNLNGKYNSKFLYKFLISDKCLVEEAIVNYILFDKAIVGIKKYLEKNYIKKISYNFRTCV